MSRRRRSQKQSREASTFANDLERLYLEPSLPTNQFASGRQLVDFSEIEDRRSHHPLHENRPALTFDGTPSTIVTDPNVNSKKHKAFIRPPRVSSNPLSVFREPARQILVCIRRQRRKEILHAYKQTGRGKGHKRARKSWLSKVHCK